MSDITYNTLSLGDVDGDDSRGGSLYVINATTPERGSIIFTCPTEKKDVVVKIEATWVPQDITTQVRRDQVMDSPDFRRLVNAGHIHMLTEKDAQRILETSDGKEEFSRVFKGSIATKQRVVIDSATRQNQARIVDESKEQISGKVISVVQRSNAEEMPTSEALALLKGMQMTASEKQYVVKTSKVDQIKNWAANVLNAAR